MLLASIHYTSKVSVKTVRIADDTAVNFMFALTGVVARNVMSFLAAWLTQYERVSSPL